MSRIKSCYIHIPFCSSICSYCDFCKFYYQENLVNQYLETLLREIEEKYQGEVLDTIYIGGGTPSSLNVSQLNKLLNGLNQLKISPQVEFTIECNIQDISEEKLLLFQRFGINRLSIGVESFHKEILDFLERSTSAKEIVGKINLAKKYFLNINIDLMYAICNESLEMLKEDLELLLSLKVPHISAYSLMVENHTKLGIQNTSPISEELDRKMYEKIHNTLTNSGYIHYEISNYAMPNYESQHNLTYWKNEKYYGFGIGASGYIGNIRYTNTKNIKKYLSGCYVQEEEVITPDIDASNYAILGLRTLQGVNKEKFMRKFSKDWKEYFSVESLIKEEIIIETEYSYYLNPQYWYISNEILVKFL